MHDSVRADRDVLEAEDLHERGRHAGGCCEGQQAFAFIGVDRRSGDLCAHVAGRKVRIEELEDIGIPVRFKHRPATGEPGGIEGLVKLGFHHVTPRGIGREADEADQRDDPHGDECSNGTAPIGKQSAKTKQKDKQNAHRGLRCAITSCIFCVNSKVNA